MSNAVEAAARFIRKGGFVLANDVLRNEYDYGQTLTSAVQQVDIPVEHINKWSDDYISGFVEGVAGHVVMGWCGMVSKHPRGLGILDGASSAQRYAEEYK